MLLCILFWNTQITASPVSFLRSRKPNPDLYKKFMFHISTADYLEIKMQIASCVCVCCVSLFHFEK